MDTALKQRLVGASVLIALAVVVLPMLLGGRPDHSNPESQKIELPPQPAELDFETRRYPIGDQKSPDPRKQETAPPKPLPSPKLSGESAPEVTQDTADQESPVIDSRPPVTSIELESQKAPDIDPVEPQPKPDPVPLTETLAATPTSDNGRYIVQVASFGAADNARRLSETLRSYGYDVQVDTVKSDVGTLHRVRVGPYASENDANGVVSRLQSQVAGIKPRVTDLQPEKVAQVTKPSDPLVRWVVQVGSFSSAANADKLVARLKLESLTAYKEQVSSSGNIIYRVRVGPFLEREEALRADTLVRERLAIDGVVMSAD
jgi:DedD protein